MLRPRSSAGIPRRRLSPLAIRFASPDGAVSRSCGRASLTLIPKQPFNKTQLQQLRLKVACLTDPWGRVIDGNHDGQPGGDFVASLKGKTVALASTGVAS